MEELLPIRLRRYYITEEYTVHPNRVLSFIEKLRYSVFGSESSRFDSQENISSALHPQPVSYIEYVVLGSLVPIIIYHSPMQSGIMSLNSEIITT